MGNKISIPKINFEDVQESINKNIIINTLPANNQSCLIKGTLNYNEEEELINNLLKTNKSKKIIIYGLHSNDESIFYKYDQLIKLGFSEIYIYIGGMFEWLCLQDIYGEELFPTTSKQLDILKYKSKSQFKTLLLEY